MSLILPSIQAYILSSICMRPGSDDTVPGKGYTLNEPLIGYCGYISGNDCCPRCYLYILAAAIRSIILQFSMSTLAILLFYRLIIFF